MLLKSTFSTQIKMKKIICLLSLVLVFLLPLSAQKLVWNANLNYFFDNTEYAKSTITKDQTMTGVHFAPEIGLAIDSVHSFFAGADLLKTAGSQNVIDDIQPLAYYRYQNQKQINIANGYSFGRLSQIG